MQCPECGAAQSRVSCTRNFKFTKKRWRHCQTCDHVFCTFEIYQESLGQH